MNPLHYTCALIVVAAAFMSPVQAQTGPADLQEQAAQALTDGNVAQALTLTEMLIAKNPDSFSTLFVRSLALSEDGQHAAAAKAAGRAYRVAQNDAERLQAARLAGGARFAAGQYSRAEWWLRRAANNVTTPQEASTVRDEFQNIRRNNPLSVRLNFSAAPSDNINNGSDDGILVFEDTIVFTPDGIAIGDIPADLGDEQRALSGIEYTGDIQLTYNLSQNARQITDFGAYVFGRTYSLSSETRDRVPDLSGSDYALALAEVSISHRRLLFDGLGPTSVSGHVGRTWFAGDPLWNYRRIVLGQDFPIGQNSVFTLQTAVQDQEALNDIQPDTIIYDLLGAFTTQLPNQDQLQFSLSGQLNDVGTVENTFTEYTATIDYNLATRLWGTKWSTSFGIGYINYEDFSQSLDGRRDKYATVGGTVTFEQISYFGFSPSLTMSARRTVSDVSFYTSSQLLARFGIESNF